MTEFYDQATRATLVVSKNGDVSGGGVVFPSSSAPLPEAPLFPTDALPAAARRFVEVGTVAIGCAPDLLALPVLAVLSAGIGVSRVVEIKRSWREGATLFLAVVASPANGPDLESRGYVHRDGKHRHRQPRGRGEDRAAGLGRQG
jgi:hypothetical protein